MHIAEFICMEPKKIYYMILNLIITNINELQQVTAVIEIDTTEI